MTQVSENQTDHMPSWPRGRGISEVFGFIAVLSVIAPIATFLIDLVFANADPFSPQLSELFVNLFMGLMFGSVWYFLKSERLALAQFAIALNGLLFVGVILWVAAGNMLDGSSIGGFNGLILYGCGSVYLFCCWLAYREVRLERSRRREPDA